MTKTEELIQKLYAAAEGLRGIHGLRFPLDGLLIGNIGEAWAAETLGLKLLAPGTPIHDAFDEETNRHIQIKTTQNSDVTLNSDVALKDGADQLLVLKLHRTGEVKVIWHGSNANAWNSAGKEQKNGERMISFNK